MRWLFLVFLAGVVAAGCGGRKQSADEAFRVQMAKVETTCATGVNCPEDQFQPFRKCTHAANGFRACTTFGLMTKRSAIYRRQGDDWVRVRGRLQDRLGWWRRAIGSPDRATVLAEWSGECESRSTYLVSAATGRARPIFEVEQSNAVGWSSSSGDARVRLLRPVYDSEGSIQFAPGVYVVDPETLAVRLERSSASGQGC